MATQSDAPIIAQGAIIHETMKRDPDRVFRALAKIAERLKAEGRYSEAAIEAAAGDFYRALAFRAASTASEEVESLKLTTNSASAPAGLFTVGRDEHMPLLKQLVEAQIGPVTFAEIADGARVASR